jgi:hypothetical protein
MIIDNLYIIGRIIPAEADAPLPVNADAVALAYLKPSLLVSSKVWMKQAGRASVFLGDIIFLPLEGGGRI